MNPTNVVILTGNVGKEVNVFKKENNTTVSFSIATNKTYKNKDNQKVTDTTWSKIVAYGPLGEIAEKYIEKGKYLTVYGELKNSKWTDKEGNERYSTDVVAHNFIFHPMGNEKSEEITKE